MYFIPIIMRTFIIYMEMHILFSIFKNQKHVGKFFVDILRSLFFIISSEVKKDILCLNS